MFNNALLMGAASAAGSVPGRYVVDYSGKFNRSAGAFMTYTPSSAGNRRQITMSYWVKRGTLSSQQVHFNSTTVYWQWQVTNKLQIFTDGSGNFEPNIVFRDPTAWYNLVFVFDTDQTEASDRFKLYINGEIISDWTTYTAITINTDLDITNSTVQRWPIHSTSTAYCMDGYLSQVCMLDGSVLDATSFGEFDDNGVWRPIDITGLTFGTTGYLIDFADSSDLGKDVSGNDNDFTTTSMDSGDQVTDTPTTNYATFASNSGRYMSSAVDDLTWTDGNLHIAGTTTYNVSDVNFVPLNTGKWYFTWDHDTWYNANNDMGIVNEANRSGLNGTPSYSYESVSGAVLVGLELSTKYNIQSADFTNIQATIPVTATTSDQTVMAVDIDNLKLWAGFWDQSEDDLYWMTAAGGWSSANVDVPATGTDETCAIIGDNFTFYGWCYSTRGGGVGFGSVNGGLLSNITQPSGFNELNTGNLPEPTIKNGTENFQTALYMGTGAVQTIGQDSNSYFNTYGSGDRTDIITSGAVLGSYNPAAGENMVDGNRADANGPGINSYATNQYFFFEFRDAVNITEVLIDMQNNGYNLGNAWVWEGSNNDWTTTTTLSSSIDMSNNTNPEIHTLNLIGASDTYSYYRIRNTNGSGLNSVCWDEFEFKVGFTRSSLTRSTFQPDFVWLKNRSEADNHMAIDAARGVTKEINPDAAASETTDANGLTAFTSSGFTLGTGAGGYNDVSESFVAWQWLAGGGAGSSNTDGTINTTTTTVNTTSGISISTYVGTGANATVGHGLGAVPVMIMARNLDAGESWRVYHVGNTSAPATERLQLDHNHATVDEATAWNDTLPTSTVFSLGSGVSANQNTKNHVAYCFADVEGYSRFSNYTGNGNADGTSIYTGFKPAWVMIKKTTGTGNWVLYDSQRSPYNEIDDQLVANNPDAETTGSEEVDFLGNGFKIRTADSDVNSAGGNYVYAAFAQNPFGGASTTPGTAY